MSEVDRREREAQRLVKESTATQLEVIRIFDAIESLADLAREYERQLDQTRVQLAGCGVAAYGGTSDAQVAKQGDYGWSDSYQATLDLRRKYDEASRRLKEAGREH